jgi:hypothetical protein
VPPNPVSRFEINETIWQIRNESGQIDNPCVISRDGKLYLIAPELDDAVDEAPYYYDDYGYSGSVEKVGVRALAAPVSDIRNQLIS